jgi:hypothetical protein
MYGVHTSLHTRSNARMHIISMPTKSGFMDTGYFWQVLSNATWNGNHFFAAYYNFQLPSWEGMIVNKSISQQHNTCFKIDNRCWLKLTLFKIFWYYHPKAAIYITCLIAWKLIIKNHQCTVLSPILFRELVIDYLISCWIKTVRLW